MNSGLRSIGIVLLAALLVLPLTFTLAMDKGLSHDEHQHVAAGALVAREGLLPYRDFPCFHTPHLAFVYGWLFESGGYLLLKARVFSALCAALTAGVLFATAWHALRRWKPGARWLGSVSALALMLCSPLFEKATGQAWNQDPSTLCALVAVVLTLAAAGSKRPGLILLASGLCLGLAVGFRLTWAPIALPLLCVIGLAREFERARLGLLAVFSAGALLGLAPLIWLFAIAPEQTLFNTFEFAKVNIVYRFATGEPRTMTILTKLRYFWKEVLRSDFAMLAAMVLCVVIWWRARARAGDRAWLRGLVAVLPFVLIGSFAPSPLFNQYFYAPVPFVILAAVFAMGAVWAEAPGLRSLASVLLLCVVAAVLTGARHYHAIGEIFSPAQWSPIKRYAQAQPLREIVGSGRVLTLAPIHALEAGLGIYPAFSTGPFAWRVAPFVPAERLALLGIVGPTELDAYLAASPPAAIHLGHEEKGEKPLSEVARARGYVRQKFGSNDESLWLPLHHGTAP